MLDTQIYDNPLYDENSQNISDTIYVDSDFWVDFWNGFKIPNSFVNSCMIKYLRPLQNEYEENRRTRVETNVYNFKKTNWEIEISWRINWTTRANLIENVEYFKKKIRDKNRIILKDWWVEKIAKVFIDDINFDENHYNQTFIRFTIMMTFRDYMAYNVSSRLDYNWNTGVITSMEFDNSWLETHYIWILKYNNASNLDIQFKVNWVALLVNSVNSGDEIIIDTDNVSVKKNWNELVFWGILSKMKAWTNEIIIIDDWGSRNFDFSLFYNKTLS